LDKETEDLRFPFLFYILRIRARPRVRDLRSGLAGGLYADHSVVAFGGVPGVGEVVNSCSGISFTSSSYLPEHQWKEKERCSVKSLQERKVRNPSNVSISCQDNSLWNLLRLTLVTPSKKIGSLVGDHLYEDKMKTTPQSWVPFPLPIVSSGQAVSVLLFFILRLSVKSPGTVFT
jgi:hypothetical protein